MAEEKLQTFAVRPVDAGTELVARVREGRFHRWVAGPRDDFQLEVGPAAEGTVRIHADVWPAAPAIRAMLRGLPIRISGETIALAGDVYPSARLGLAVRLPDSKPSTWVVLGPDVVRTASLVDSVLFQAAELPLGWGGPKREIDYLLRQHRWAERSGRWSRGPEGGFGIDSEEKNDFAEREAFEASLRPEEVGALRWQRPGRTPGPELSAVQKELSRWIEQIAEKVPVALEPLPEVVIEPDFVSQGRHLGAIGEAVVAADAETVHLVFHPDDTWAYRQALARLLIRRAGIELPPWFEDGAALWLGGQWYGRDYGEWTTELARLQTLPTAEELLAGERQRDSSAVLWPPVAATLIDRLPGRTLQEKVDRSPSPEGLAGLLEALRVEARAEAGEGARRARARLPGFVRGVSLAMSNGMDVGYHAPGIDDQLRVLRRMGADGVSIMPFAYQSDPKRPELAFLNRSPTSETDVGAVHATRRARAAGFTVLWKPHIWLSHDSWPGEIEMTTEAAWAAWWRVYRRYILHHAVLARFAGAEVFSIGVELGRTVHREREWRSLIAAVRQVYPGLVTYSGNWAGDYDQVPFWDALDYVGVDAYFPLAAEETADRASLRSGARRVVERLQRDSERFGRPILLTEFGFAARRGAWVAPHEEGGTYDLEHQALAYEVFLETLGRPSWLAGGYAWKVFSHAEAEGGRRPDFRFLGRPAEESVARWFGVGRSEESGVISTPR